MTTHVHIDFVSDISCPWCAIGLASLENALAQVQDAVDADIVFQPFELNPMMPFEGQNIVEHVAEKYGYTREQSDQNRLVLIERAKEAGFDMKIDADSRIYNTFDAHRLLHWAGSTPRQLALKHALFRANFTEGRNPGETDVLLAAVDEAGLDVEQAREVLNSGRYAAEVRTEMAQWRVRGIAAVPAIVLNGRYLVSGGQPAEVFAQTLLEIAAQDLV